MGYQTQNVTFSWEWGPTALGFAVFGLLVGFWVSLGLDSIGLSLPFVQEVLGFVLLTFVPGIVLTRLLGLEINRLGELLVFSVGLSAASLSILVVSTSVVLPSVGVTDPLALYPLAVVFSGFLSVLTIAVWVTDAEFDRRQVDVTANRAVAGLSALLLLLAVAGAAMRNLTGDAYGIALFVAVAAASVIVVSTRLVRSSSYPMFLFALSLSALLHRNLVTSYIVGEDVQFEYFVSGFVTEAGVWSPDVGGSIAAIPVVTGVPTVYTVLAGIELVLVFKLINSFVFSLVPLGIYYLATELFDEEVALYGSLFFLFYHYSFYFTPGKQLLSQLFLVLLLLLYVRHDTSRTGTSAIGVILAVGLVQSHYGTTYVFGLALLFGALTLFLSRRLVGGFSHRLSLAYPLGFLTGATVWYGYASPSLTIRLAELPFGLVEQILSLATGAPIGAGTTYVEQQTSLLQQLVLFIYALALFLVCVGVFWYTVENLRRLVRREDVRSVELTVLAIPLLAFLALSYVVILDLYADRVYQMVLPVVVPFLGVGFSLVYVNRERLRGSLRPNWSVLAVVVAALFVLNSGLAFAAVGDADDYTFNENAQDYAFSDEEVAAAEWVESQPDIEPVQPGSTVDEDEVVPIYTDAYSYQLFRSIAPESFYNVEIIMLKDQWDPTLDPDETTDGYVFIRHNGVVDADAQSEPVPITHLSSEEVSELTDDRTVVFENEDVTIVEPAE